MTIVVDNVESSAVDQITKQLYNVIEVVKVSDITDEEIVTQLYLAAVCRSPSEKEMEASIAHLKSKEDRVAACGRTHQQSPGAPFVTERMTRPPAPYNHYNPRSVRD